MIPEHERSAAREARHAAVKSLIEPLEAFRRCFGGGSQTVVLTATGLGTAPPSQTERVLAAIERAAKRHEENLIRDRPRGLRASERAIAVQDLRERADALERGV